MEFMTVCEKYLGWCPNAPAIRPAPALLWSHLRVFIPHKRVTEDLQEVLAGSGMASVLLPEA